MADLVFTAGEVLLSTISNACELWGNRCQNVEVLKELKQFMIDLQLNIVNLQKKCFDARCSNSTVVALDALQMDLDSANVEAKTILNNGFIRSVWDANKTLDQLQRLHQRVMTSFQTKLTIATLDVMIETKQGLDSFKESMVKVNDRLLELYSTNSGFVRNLLREELQKALQPVMAALDKANGGVEAVVSMIHNTDPQTSETEKFFADVLEGLKPLTEQSNSTKSDETHGMSQLQWYQDPVTWETMCDPVKGTDGHTYDRWTFLRHASSMTRSPLLGDTKTPFRIAVDDLSVRSRLFHEFPEQEERCKVERAAYKDEALQAAHLDHLGDALIMLNNVLMWNPNDEECRSKRDDIEHKIVSEKPMTEASQEATSSRSCAPVNPQGVLREQWSDVSKVEELNYVSELEATCSRSCAPVEVPREQWSDAFEAEDLNGKLEEPNYPSVAGLQSHGAQVKLNFGQSPYSFWNEPYPTRLDSMTCDENHLVPSPDGLSLETKENSGTFRAILADKPVPVRTTLFYFEVFIKSAPPSKAGSVALGFTGTDGFQQEGFPGNWKNSCGYQSGFEESFILDSQGTRLKSKTHPAWLVGWHHAFDGDRIGAGIHYDSNELFFVKNGVFIGAVSNTLTGKLMPALAVKHNYKVEVKFGSSVNTCSEICKLSGFKSTSIWRTDELRFKNRGNSGIIAFQGDNVAPFHQESFYFELTVEDSGKNGNITVGFCHHRHFRDDMQPGGYPHSCGYNGATGKLFTGSETGKEFGPTFSVGDTVGAGISFKTNLIFFVKNSKVINIVPNEMMSCALYPVVSLGSVGEVVQFNFGEIV